MADPVYAVLERLDKIRGRDPKWSALCPAHPDSTPSLSVERGKTQPVVVHCHAGCESDAVLAAINLSVVDLMQPQDQAPEKAKVVATYDYVDEAGKLLYQVVRMQPKGFWQRRPDFKGGWINGLGDVRRVLYRLPEVIQAVAHNQAVWVVGGEKDVHAMEGAGCVATTVSAGEHVESWSESDLQLLAGAVVTIVADNDEQGRRYALALQTRLEPVAHRVRVVCSPKAKDAADHLAMGLSVAEFVDLDDAPEVEAAPEPDRHRLRVLNRSELDSIRPPEWLVDGIFTTGLTTLFGPSGGGKSFVGVDWSCHVSTGLPWFGRQVKRKRVLYIAAEGASGLARRVRSWEKDRGARADDLYVAPQASNAMSVPDMVLLSQEIQERQIGMVVVDTLARSMTGGDENAAQDIGIVVNALEQIKATHDCAVVLIHHSGVERGRPRGSTALRGAMDTVVICEGTPGRVTITCDKQKDDEKFAPWSFKLKPVGESVVLSTTGERTADDNLNRIRDALGGGMLMSYPELVRLVDGDGELVALLVEARKLVSVEQGSTVRYRLADVDELWQEQVEMEDF